MSTDEPLPPIAFAEHRKKKRSGTPGTWHFRITRCPHCGRPHSAPALGLQLSECVGDPRIYRVVEVETEPGGPR
jgi:hypothetical protein